MICSYCGTDLPLGAMFCGECGRPVAARAAATRSRSRASASSVATATRWPVSVAEHAGAESEQPSAPARPPRRPADVDAAAHALVEPPRAADAVYADPPPSAAKAAAAARAAAKAEAAAGAAAPGQAAGAAPADDLPPTPAAQEREPVEGTAKQAEAADLDAAARAERDAAALAERAGAEEAEQAAQLAAEQARARADALAAEAARVAADTAAAETAAAERAAAEQAAAELATAERAEAEQAAAERAAAELAAAERAAAERAAAEAALEQAAAAQAAAELAARELAESQARDAEASLPPVAAPVVQEPAVQDLVDVQESVEYCAQCGEPLAASDIFCGECGFVRKPAAVAPPRPSDTAAYDPFPWGLPRPGDVVPADQAPEPPDESYDDDSDVEKTRIVDRSVRGDRFVLQFSTGESVSVSGTGLIGRNPVPEPGEYFDTLVTIVDPGKSVSKTHLEFGQDAGAFWVSDRYSANGTVLREPDRPARRGDAGKRYRVVRGTRVDIGEQFFIVS